MNDIDGQNTEFTDDDEIHITNLDTADSPQQRRARLIASILKKTLATPWIRYGISSLLILTLLVTLVLQWPRPAPAPSNAIPTPTRAFRGTATAQGLVFIQASNFTLNAYQITNWHVRWHASLPAAAYINTQGQTLYCYFATLAHQTDLEALNENTGQVIWHDTLPATFTNIIQLSKDQATPAFIYNNNALYVQSTSDTIYAIQASTGRFNWTYQANDAGSQSPSVLNPQIVATTLDVQNGIAEFISTKAITYILDANTGRKILSFPPGFSFPLPIIDGQMIYAFPPPSGKDIQAFHIPDGRLIWTYPLPAGDWAQIAADGVVYLGAAQGATLIALRGNDGHQLWSYNTSDGQPVAGTFLGEYGISYLLQHDATLISIRESDGHVLWHTQVADFVGQLNQIVELLVDNGNLVLRNLTPDSSLPTDVLSASNGHLLWRSSGPLPNPYLSTGILYAIENNGQIDAWRESDGQRLWSYNAPIGSSIVWSLQNIPNVLFFQDIKGNLYAVRASDGKLLWRYPLMVLRQAQGNRSGLQMI